MKKLMIIALFLVLCLKSVLVVSQIPPGYYDSAAGLTGTALKTALHNIIKNHTSISYAQLWTAYQTTDVKPDGKVWDIYSDIPGGTAPYEFTFVTDQCGSYSAEDNCYNREHSFPESWFGGASPMYSDIFHIYPTDGWVNNKRGNYPYGDVGTASWTSLNGSKLGTCSDVGYAGTVFEPIDSFKGDVARSYFYMATRYYTEDAGWPGSDMVSGSQLKPWAETVMLQWNALDTVSQKERDRNNTIYYTIQHNRNPFIDHPEWVYYIWGPTAGTADIEMLNDFVNVYPVPATGNVTIFCGIPSAHFKSVSLYSIEGALLYESNCSQETGKVADINVSDFSAGMYFVKLNSDQGIVTKQLVIQK
jgi:endonuclease I